MFKTLIFLFSVAPFSKAHAQRFDLPSMDFLKSCVDSFYKQKTKAEVLEFQDAGRGRWLNYIPSPGYSPFTGGFTFSLNLAAPLQEAKARRISKAQVRALHLQNAAQSAADKQVIATEYRALEMAINAFQAGNLIDSLQAQLFQLSKSQYSRQELTPTEYMNRQQSYQAYKISRLNQDNAVRRGVLDLLTKAHAPVWAFEKITWTEHAQNQ